MKKSLKIETGILILGGFLYFLLLKIESFSLAYLLFTIGASLYFFPIKIILQRNDKNLLLLVLSGFIISTCLSMSYVSFILGDDIGFFLKIFLLLLLVGNLILCSKLLMLKNKLYILHILIYCFLPMIYFKM